MERDHLLGHLPPACRSRQRHVHTRGGIPLEATLKMYRSMLLLTIAAGVPACGQSGSTRPDTHAAILKKWTLARCLAHAAEQTPTGDDAAKTAAAYLEMGNVGVDVYEKLDA